MMRAMGINIAHIFDFHGDGHPHDPGPLRLKELETYFEGCRRHSDADFLILPGEEANAYLGGHYNILFPKPVYWTLVRGKDQPLVEDDPKYGKVYHTGSAADVFEVMKREDALVWTTHPRTKGSTGYPDKIKDTDYFRSDHWLGTAFKALPVDLSQKRLGEVRCFGTLDDMNNWGGPKYMVGEVDTYKKFPDYDLYGDFNVNYVKLDRVPSFDDWSPVCRALRAGEFFVTTGEVLIPSWSVEGERQGAGGRGRRGVDVPAGVRRGGLGRRRAGGPDGDLGDGPAALRVAPVPHPVRCVGQEVGAILGLGLGGQRGVHAAGATAVENDRKQQGTEIMTRRKVGILVFPEVEVLDFCGPFEVFSVTRLDEDRRREEPSPYEVILAAEKKETVVATGGLKVIPDYSLDDCPPLDVLVVPGGWGTLREMNNDRLVAWLSERARQVTTLTSVCTGSLLLGKADHRCQPVPPGSVGLSQVPGQEAGGS